MRIAVTDACIFIDLILLELTDQFFCLPLEIHSSFDVFDELHHEQQQIFNKHISTRKLTIHNLSQEDFTKIHLTIFPKSLSESDKTVIYLAEKLQAMLLSSDKIVRNFSKANAIEYHGMLWVLDQLLISEQIAFRVAIQKLNDLISNNIVYQNNMELAFEINKRIEKWERACQE